MNGVHNYVEFKEETISQRIRNMLEMRDEVDVESEHIRLSYGNRKTTAMVPSVSLIPVADCGNCKLCYRGCYDVRNVCCYKQSRKQRAVNSAIFKSDRERYFQEIELHAHFHRYFRFHIGGDIKDYDYLVRMVRVAADVPDCQFLCFTKMFDIVNEYLDKFESFPDNLHIIFSDWRGMEMENRHNLPVSSPKWKDSTTGPNVSEKSFLCPGNYAECATVGKGCWIAKKGDTILFEAH